MIFKKLMRFVIFNNNNKVVVYMKVTVLLLIFIYVFVVTISHKVVNKKLIETSSATNGLKSDDSKNDPKLNQNIYDLNDVNDYKVVTPIIDLKSDNQINEDFQFLDNFEDKNRVIRYGGYSGHTMKIAITVCGNQTLQQSLVTLKSAALLTESRLHFIIMTDEDNRQIIRQFLLTEWPKHILSRISFEIHLVSFPNTLNAEEWRKLFKLCAAQRLFLPTILKDIDSVLYVDTDVLFLTPIDQIWTLFQSMNSSQMAAMSPESEDFASSWYHRFAKHPYVERLGVNSGVMLMNLTRMRTFGWTDYLEPYLSLYKHNIVWGDQDIINIIFHYNSDKLYIFTCDWNYRPDHCIYTRVCKPAEQTGVRIIHGNRGVFLNEKQPSFRAIYESFKDFSFNNDLSVLLDVIKTQLENSSNTNCGKARHSFTLALEAFLSNQH